MKAIYSINLLKFFRRPQAILDIVVILLLILWIPVTIDKVLNFSQFERSILRQPFSDKLGHILVYLLPTLETLTIITLVLKKFRKFGIMLSAVLMSLFSGYITLALLGAWEKLPCGCGSVIKGMTWTQHLFFNLFFLATSIAGYYLHRSLHRSTGSGIACDEGLPSAI